MKDKDASAIIINPKTNTTDHLLKTKKSKPVIVEKSDPERNPSNPKLEVETHFADQSNVLADISSEKEKSQSVEEYLEEIELQSNKSDDVAVPIIEQPPKKNIKGKPKRKKTVKKTSFAIEGTTEVTSIELMSKSTLFQILYYIISVVTLGLFMLFNKWSNNKIYSRLCFRRVSSLQDANYVALNDVFGFFVISRLFFKNLLVAKDLELETFVFEHNYRTFYFDETSCKFANLVEVAEKDIYDNFAKSYKSARLEEDVGVLRETFGTNKLQPNLKSFRSLVLDSILTPLVFFEGLVLVLLGLNSQMLYFWFLLVLFLIVLSSNVQEKFQAETKLLESINFAEKIMVVRRTSDGVFKKKIIDSSELVVGDLVEITNNLRVPADMVLTHGACIVKEDFNKDTPRTSTRIAFDTIGIDEPRNAKCSLLAGNQVLYTINQINEGCFAIVLRTGFNCKRAEKLKLIINNQIKQKQDKWEIFLLASLLLLCLGFPVVAMIISKIFHKNAKLIPGHLLSQLNDLVLIFLKPIVPLLLIVVTKLSTRRLIAQNITISDKEKLRHAGRLREIIFENKLLLAEEKTTAGFVLSNNIEVDKPIFEKILTSGKRLFKSAENNAGTKRFCEVAGMCNLVFKVGKEFFGSETEKELLSQSAFNLTNYNTRDSSCGRVFVPKNEYAGVFAREYQVKRFLTSSKGENHKVQSVLVRSSNEENLVLTKGDPNSIESLFDLNTLPSNFNSRIAKYANKGFKCLAFGFKKVSDDQTSQNVAELETNLTFLGFYLFKFAAPENVSEITRSLQTNNINITLMSNGSIFSGIATARNNEIIAADKKVILLQTEIVNGAEKFVLTMMEPKIGSVSINESAVIGEKLNIVTLEDSNQNAILNSNDSIAITGNAFMKLCQSESQEFVDTVLDRCRVYGNLTDQHRNQIVCLLRQRNLEQPIGYVYEDIGNENIIKEADISINLRANSLSSYSTFSSATSDLGLVLDIIKEGKATHANLIQAIYFGVFFIALQIIGYCLLVYKETTYSRVQLFFLDFVVLSGFALFQANLKPVELTADLPSRYIWDRKFIVRVFTSVTTSATVLFVINWLLYKTKFYISPAIMSANTKDKSPEAFFYYDPFTVFIILVFINIFFVFHAHQNNKFVKSFFGKIGLLVYTSIVFLFSTYLLFVYHFSSKWILNQTLIKFFRAPGMFHFEIIILLFMPVIYFSFNLAKNFQARILGKNQKAKKVVDEEMSVSVEEVADRSVKRKRKIPLIDEQEESVEGSEKNERNGKVAVLSQAKEKAAKVKTQIKQINKKIKVRNS